MKHYTVTIIDKQPGCWKLTLTPRTNAAEAPLAPAATRPQSVGQVKPTSITAFIRSEGGLDPDYNHGQWRHELAMLREQGKGLMPGLLKKSSVRTFEEHAQACADAGYIMEADVDMMLWALAKDVEATAYNEPWNRVYGYDGHAWAAEQDYQRWAESVDQIAA